MVYLKNEELELAIGEVGAEMKSLLHGGTEYLWQGDPAVWKGIAPLMFPICGGLAGDKFCFEGKEYTLQKHGYGRFLPFEVESATDTGAVFFHKANGETEKQFPFDYELRVSYELHGRSVAVCYEVKNLASTPMYFNIGAHEGYRTPEGIEDYDVIFDGEETLSANVLYGNLLSDQKLPILKKSRVLPLYDKYFTVDALVFTDVKSKAATLRNRKTGRGVRVEYPDAPYLLLWHKSAAPYICVEPWNGIPDKVGHNGMLKEKEGITELAGGGIFRFAHTITVIPEEKEN